MYDSFVDMKTISTLFITPLMMGLAIAAYVLSSNGYEGYSVLQWCLAIVAVLLVGLIIGSSLNLAVFAPIYWILGRLQSKKNQTEKKHGDDG